MNAQQHTPHKQQTKKIILTTVVAGAAGILGYFGWQYYKKKKGSGSGGDSTNNLDDLLKASTDNASASINFDEPTIPVSSSKPLPKKSTASPAPKKINGDTSEFPLVRGSKGEKVKQLQNALISKYGKSILPKYGADGSYGSEMVSALKKLGLPASIDQSTFNVLTESASGSSSSGSSLGRELFTAVFNRDFNKVMSVLKKINSKDDYVSANEVFKTYRLGGVRQTIVNAVLGTFTSAEQKQKIKFELLRIGLQYDGNQWSLSGIGGVAIITIIPTSVWMNAKQCVRVPARMVLGNEISKRLGYTLFENRGKYFLVPTNAVQYL